MRTFALVVLALAALVEDVSAFASRNGLYRSPAMLKRSARAAPAVRMSVESVDKATRHWCATVTSGADDNWARVKALYAEDAILWGTVSDDMRSGADLTDYFKWFAMIPGLSLVDGSYKSFTQVMGDRAINSGYFTFLIPQRSGEVKTVPARFTFVYRKLATPTADGIEWEIVNHHNSVVPEQPAALMPLVGGSSAPSAADIESVDKATRHWCATVTSGAENNWQRVTALYADDALLWGTVSKDIRGGQDLIDYFKYFAHIPGLALMPGSYKSQVQVFGDEAINSGYYTFYIPQTDGNVKAVPARFTFVYRRRAEPTADGIEWDIVNHHSAAVPAQPEALKPVLSKQ